MSEDLLSGDPGVLGRRAQIWGRVVDRALDVGLRLRGAGAALDRAAERVPVRTVLVTGVYRPGGPRMPAIVDELRGTRHDLRIVLGSTGAADPDLAEVTAAEGLAGGKFQNLNALLAGTADVDWTIVCDDDVALPERFVDRLLGASEALELALAQPALTRASHGAWRVTRRRPGALARETRFVEIGPVTALRADAAATLVPFPDLRYGWGLDLHWAALAAERGWPLGVIDALPVAHEDAPVAAAYGREQALAEARAFLSARPHLSAAEAQGTVAVHRRL